MPDLNTWLYPAMTYLNSNAGAVQTLSSIMLVIITAYYAYQTRRTVSLMSDVKIKITFGSVWIHNSSQHDPTKSYFNITVRNLSRNSIRIEKASIKTVTTGWLLLADSFSDNRNKILSPETPISEFLVESSQIDLDNSYYISVFDGFGNEYRKYLHKLPTFWLLLQKIKKISLKSILD